MRLTLEFEKGRWRKVQILGTMPFASRVWFPVMDPSRSGRAIPLVELELHRADHRKRRAGIDDLPEVLRAGEIPLIQHVGEVQGGD